LQVEKVRCEKPSGKLQNKSLENNMPQVAKAVKDKSKESPMKKVLASRPSKE